MDADGLIRSVGLSPAGTVTWGDRVTEAGPGVYVVSTPEPLDDAPLDEDVIHAWIRGRPEMQIDGERATVATLAARLRSFWIPRETIVYVGLAGSSLRKRLSDYYRTPLRARAPHAGGHWIKTLSVLSDLHVTWATAADPDGAEDALLRAFGAGLSDAIREALPSGPALPFANLETSAKVRKRHGITGSKEPRVRSIVGVMAPDPTGTTRPIEVRRARATGRPRRRADLAEINTALQRFVAAQPGRRATAVEAAAELDRLGLLPDSELRRGKPLRELLRAGVIDHAYQEGGRLWFIEYPAQERAG